MGRDPDSADTFSRKILNVTKKGRWDNYRVPIPSEKVRDIESKTVPYYHLSAMIVKGRIVWFFNGDWEPLMCTQCGTPVQVDHLAKGQTQCSCGFWIKMIDYSEVDEYAGESLVNNYDPARGGVVSFVPKHTASVMPELGLKTVVFTTHQ